MADNSPLPVVLVTGGATRIGAEIARGFGDAGWHVIIHHLSSHDEAEALLAELPSAQSVQCDLTDDAAVDAMVAQLEQHHANWRCLINSAAVFRYDDATKLDPATNREAMQVNALSPARLTQGFLARARGSEPRTAIQITDMKTANPNPDFFSYTMSKNAAASTIPMLAMSAPEDARVYGIAPGAILASHDQDEAETEVSHRLNLLQRKTGPGEIVDAALFLAGGTLKNGSTIFIDSGQHLLSQPRDVIYLAREKADQA